MKLKTLLNKIIYKSIRKSFIKDIVTNIGIIIEKDDKFISYARQYKIDDILKKEYYYDITLEGIRELEEDDRNINQKYDLNKPIYYIFENMEFDERVEISANRNNTYLIFRNCEFKKSISIKWANEIIFENNKYYDNGRLFYSKQKNYLEAKINMINKITFINDNFINSREEHHPTRFGMNLNLDTLEIINSNISINNTVKYKDKVMVPNKEGLIIKANEIKITNSKIDVDELYLDAHNITIDELSIINANSGVIIENMENDLNNINIKTPYLSCNGIEIKNLGSKSFNNTNITKEKLKLQKARVNLLNTLKNISNKGTSIIEERVEKHKDSLNNSAIKKVLKPRK